MFDLEQSIADWWQQFLAAGMQSPTPMEELEIHLREDTEQQMRLGLNAQRAFENAVLKMGQASMVKKEFSKVGGAKQTLLEKTLATAAAVNILLGTFWMFLGFHAVHEMWRLSRLRVLFDPGDLQYLAISWVIALYGAICGGFTIFAAIQIFRHRLLGVTLMARCSALTIFGVVVDALWRIPQFGFTGRILFLNALLLTYPLFLFLLCRNPELKKQYG